MQSKDWGWTDRHCRHCNYRARVHLVVLPWHLLSPGVGPAVLPAVLAVVRHCMREVRWGAQQDVVCEALG